MAVDGPHGQTDAAHRDALGDAGAVDHRPGANPQARAIGKTLDGQHLSHFFDDSRKHQAATYPSITTSAPRRLTLTSRRPMGPPAPASPEPSTGVGARTPPMSRG